MRGLRGLTCSLLGAALVLASSGAVAAGVYVAGQGFSLEQAVEQALNEQPAGEGAQRFWIVASGAAAKRVAEADGRAAELLERVRAHGGLVYVCARDLDPDTAGALPPGVGLVPVHASSSGGVVPPPQAEENVAPDSHYGYRLILRACAALQ